MSNDKLQKPPTLPSGSSIDVATGRVRIGHRPVGVAARVAEASVKQQTFDTLAATMPNRIGLMLDCSGSMAGQAIADLKDAVTGFCSACSPADTAVAVETFPVFDPVSPYGREGVSVPLTTQMPLVIMETQTLFAGGGTPLAECLAKTISTHSITRGVVVSDGQPDSFQESDVEAYREMQIPIDTVHIGRGAGEEVMKQIAELTGGKYLKFDRTTNFAASFKFLAPAYRALLNAPGVAAQIGATEVK